MNIERLVQNLSSNQKHLIINSMQELMQMTLESSKIQEEIIKYLPAKDIIKLMRYLEDNDSNIRKLTAKFFLDLVYDNYIVQQVFCDILGIIPWDGKICLNRIPDVFRNVPKALPECIEALKQTYHEEDKEELPFCWYFSIQNVDQIKKKVDFIFKEEIDKEQFEISHFIDPLYSVIGFCMRNPKKLYEKHAKEYFIEKTMKMSDKFSKNSTKTGYLVNTNISARFVSSVNSSLDHSLSKKLSHDSTRSPNARIFSGLSPIRSNPINTLSNNRYLHKSKGRGGITKEGMKSSNNMAQSLCKTERVVINDFETSQERADELTYKSLERDFNIDNGLGNRGGSICGIPEFNKRMVSSVIRDSEMSLDNFDYLQTSKVSGSINESLDFNPRSTLSIHVQQNKSVEPKCQTMEIMNLTKSKFNDISPKNQTNTLGVKKFFDKNSLNLNNGGLTSSINNTNTNTNTNINNGGLSNTAINLKNQEKKALRTSKETFYSTNSPTPKNNLLSKLLKDKPFILKDSYSSKYKSNQENGPIGNFSSNHGGPTKKSSIATIQKSKNTNNTIGVSSIQQASSVLERIENEYINKKQAFHSSLLKSVDATEKLTFQTLPDDYAELNRESHSINKENFKTVSSVKLTSTKAKFAHLASYNFKSPISTPRQQTDGYKGPLNSSKLLNARKSHDISNITKHKQKASNDIFSPNLATTTPLAMGYSSNLKNIKQLDLRAESIAKPSLSSSCTIYKLEKPMSPKASNLHQPRQILDENQK